MQKTILEERRNKMIVRWFLFETRLGEALLAQIERRLGLAVVRADWLADQYSGRPQAVGGQ
jgi:hypothetical protein